MAYPGFPRMGWQLKKAGLRVVNLELVKFTQKLHENDKNWTVGASKFLLCHQIFQWCIKDLLYGDVLARDPENGAK